MPATTRSSHDNVAQSQRPSKRRLGDTELEAGEPAPQIRRVIVDKNGLSGVDAAERSSGPPLSDGKMNPPSA